MTHNDLKNNCLETNRDDMLQQGLLKNVKDKNVLMGFNFLNRERNACAYMPTTSSISTFQQSAWSMLYFYGVIIYFLNHKIGFQYKYKYVYHILASNPI